MKNIKLYYKPEDKEVIADIRKAVLYGYDTAIDYFDILDYEKEIKIYVYNDIEKLHMETFGEKKEDWCVCCEENDKNTIRILSPLNPGKVHNYDSILKILSKSVADIILHNSFKKVPNWFDITTYITGLNTETKTYSKPSISKFKNEDYFNFDDSYFIARYIAETYGKYTVLEILKNPNNYNNLLRLSDKELDKKIEEYYEQGE